MNFLMFALVSGCSRQDDVHDPASLLAAVPVAEAPPTPETLPLNGGWLEVLHQQLDRDQYSFHADDDGSFHAASPLGGVFGRVSADGLTAHATEVDDAADVEIHLAAWGREPDLQIAPPADPQALDDRVALARDGIVETWADTHQGLEHAFTVDPVPGVGPLVIALEIAGADLALEGDNVLLQPDVGLPLHYRDAKAWDETGEALPVWFEIEGHRLSIVVDDTDATGVIQVDPLLGKLWTVYGSFNTDFGFSIASAGDVNGDGYGDIVVGAPLFDNSNADAGKAYLYLGGAGGQTTTATWSPEGNTTSMKFGYSVASAGDNDDDGYSDILVGAPYYDATNLTNEGAVYLYRGKSGATAGASTTAVVLTVGVAGAHLGWSVAGLAAATGTRYGAIVAGAPEWTNNSSTEAGEGGVFVWLGPNSASGAAPNFSLDSDQANAALGTAVAFAGDTNGDGYADVAAGAPNYDSSGKTNDGKAYLWMGSSLGYVNNPATYTGGENSARLGIAVAGVDGNGDGYSDLLIGADKADAGQTDEGVVYVHDGSSTGPVAATSATLQANDASAQFGHRVAALGDVNGDGYGDAAVAAPFYAVSGGNGAVFVFYGQPGGFTDTAQLQYDNGSSSNYGSDVSSAGDLNGDGCSDMILSDDHDTVFAFLGSTSNLGTVPTNLALSPTQNNAGFGSGMASAGDVNGDGYGDVVVGAATWDGTKTDEGRVLLFYGSATGLSTTAAWTDELAQASANLGNTVAGIGDVNGDGYADFAAGAYKYDKDYTDEGGVFVYLGASAGPASTFSTAYYGGQANAQLGWAVSPAGDMNGDGYADLAAGAYKYDVSSKTNAGLVAVYVGSATGLGGKTWLEIDGTSTDQNLGYSLAAGDVDDDGLSDLAVGAIGKSSGDGAALLYVGRTAGGKLTTSDADWTALGQFAEKLGSSVGISDVNGDGYGDVLASTAMASAYEYDGSASGPSPTLDDVVATFSASVVANAGDVNGDGYGDVITSYPLYDGNSTDVGEAELIYGSSTGLTGSGWSLTGTITNGRVGWRIGSAGDVNGDGFGDLFVSSDGYTGGGQGQVFYGNEGDGTRNAFPLRAVARDANGVLAPLARAASNTFDVEAVVRGVQGQTQGALQVEAKPFGTSFDGTGLSQATSWTTFDNLGTTVTRSVSSLTSDTAYHWRVRVKYRPARVPLQPYSPWMYGGESGFRDGVHLRTACAAGTDFDVDGLCDATDPDDDNDDDPDVTDCADTNAAIHAGATEIVDDGIDQDCDGVDACYRDLDGDQYGTSTVIDDTDLDCGNYNGGASDLKTDCDDIDPDRFPGHAETTGDGVDSDCNGGEICFTDVDHDGYGVSTTVVSADLDCTDLGEADDDDDCSDGDGAINPGAAEVVDDGIDQDCDLVDGCYTDLDNDGHGALPIVDDDGLDCDDAGALTAGLADDCDDGSPNRFPGNIETVNDQFDQDCDGVDSCYRDLDDDGHGVPTIVDDNGLDCSDSGALTSGLYDDCDDSDATTYLGAPEICDGIDNDCDVPTDIDEGTTLVPWYKDVDGDGYGNPSDLVPSCIPVPGRVTVSDDCDDNDPTTHPGATEECGFGDQNCDGQGDTGAVDAPTWYADADVDGFGDPAVTTALCTQPTGYVADSTDCDDAASGTHPGADELCGGADENCDGQGDVGAIDAPIWYADADADGHGDPGVQTADCLQPAGMVAASDDCDDLAPDVNPDAIETCDDRDEDCDGTPDNGVPTTTWYTDADGDGFGDAAAPIDDCAQPAGTVSNPDDCDDDAIGVHPGATETCEGTDEDCDGSIDEDAGPTWYADVDGDGFGDGSNATAACVQPSDMLASAGDCNDADDTVHPGAVEACDGADQDCDGIADLLGERTAASANVAVDPLAAGDHLGRAVAVGDFDGDGLRDLAVGVPGDDTAGSRAGAVLVFFGPMASSVVGPGDADAVLTGQGAGARLGRVLANAGDVDADGSDDLVIGGSAAVVYVVSGQSLGGTSDVGALAAAKILGLAVDAVAGAGDIDDNGHGDVIIGGPIFGGTGAAWLFLGPLAGDLFIGADEDASFTGLFPDGLFGRALAGPGDLDGDGTDDLVIGAPGDGTVAFGAGAAFVFRGDAAWASAPAALDATDAWATFTGIRRDRVGNALAPAGDLDGDGKADVWIGAKREGFDNAGAVYGASAASAGGGSLDAVAHVRLDGALPGDVAGTSIAYANANGDGEADVLVGGRLAYGGATATGAAWLVYGPFAAGVIDLGSADAKFDGPDAGSNAGQVVAAGDIDGDGTDDLVVGGSLSSNATRRGGGAWVFRGEACTP